MFGSLVQSARTVTAHGYHHWSTSPPCWYGVIHRYAFPPAPDRSPPAASSRPRPSANTAMEKGTNFCCKQAPGQQLEAKRLIRVPVHPRGYPSSWPHLIFLSNDQAGWPLGIPRLNTKHRNNSIAELLHQLPWLWKVSSLYYTLYSAAHTHCGAASLIRLWFSGVKRYESILFKPLELEMLVEMYMADSWDDGHGLWDGSQD